MDAKNALLPHMYGGAAVRGAADGSVRGQAQPLLFGKPAEWAGWLVQAPSSRHRGRWRMEALRDKAFEAAPTTSGTITIKEGDQPFEWIADADGRLGPCSK